MRNGCGCFVFTSTDGEFNSLIHDVFEYSNHYLRLLHEDVEFILF